MSTLQPGDGDLHYSDGSHRWAAPPGIDQDVWEQAVRDHQGHHRFRLGDMPATPSVRDHPATHYPRHRPRIVEQSAASYRLEQVRRRRAEGRERRAS